VDLDVKLNNAESKKDLKFYCFNIFGALEELVRSGYAAKTVPEFHAVLDDMRKSFNVKVGYDGNIGLEQVHFLFLNTIMFVLNFYMCV
jgi:hypothetical protein